MCSSQPSPHWWPWHLITTPCQSIVNIYLMRLTKITDPEALRILECQHSSRCRATAPPKTGLTGFSNQLDPIRVWRPHTLAEVICTTAVHPSHVLVERLNTPKCLSRLIETGSTTGTDSRGEEQRMMPSTTWPIRRASHARGHNNYADKGVQPETRISLMPISFLPRKLACNLLNIWFIFSP